MEIIVEDIYKDVIKGFPTYCNCAICEADVICMVLNELPPMYNTTSLGQAYAKLSEIQPEFKVHVIQAVGRALENVNKKPRH